MKLPCLYIIIVIDVLGGNTVHSLQACIYSAGKQSEFATVRIRFQLRPSSDVLIPADSVLLIPDEGSLLKTANSVVLFW